MTYEKTTSLILILILLLPSKAVFAWSEGGHHIISLIAFDLLSKEEQGKFLEILSKHPRYNDDFIPPRGLPNEQEEQRWKVGRVGYWPDIARSQPKYNRPTWHYELGASLIVGDKLNLNVPNAPGLLPVVANLETQDLYASQAVTLCSNALGDSSTSPTDRAIALCWIGHLVADIHQPCHAGSLYMENVFSEADGDRGANGIITKQNRNMHALWDGLLGRDFDLADTRRRIFEITGDQDLARTVKPDGDWMNPQTWLSESRVAATSYVYTPEVLDNLKASIGTQKGDPIVLDEAYLKMAGRIAQQRAIQAAHRLSEKNGTADCRSGIDRFRVQDLTKVKIE
jgi:hypothetical protein